MVTPEGPILSPVSLLLLWILTFWPLAAINKYLGTFAPSCSARMLLEEQPWRSSGVCTAPHMMIRLLLTLGSVGEEPSPWPRRQTGSLPVFPGRLHDRWFLCKLYLYTSIVFYFKVYRILCMDRESTLRYDSSMKYSSAGTNNLAYTE